MPWCRRCGTAISQHEILTEEYQEITHKSVYFTLPIISQDWEDYYLLVWTTTPWTIPAMAVAVDEKKNMVVEDNGKIDFNEITRGKSFGKDYKLTKY